MKQHIMTTFRTILFTITAIGGTSCLVVLFHWLWIKPKVLQLGTAHEHTSDPANAVGLDPANAVSDHGV